MFACMAVTLERFHLGSPIEMVGNGAVICLGRWPSHPDHQTDPSAAHTSLSNLSPRPWKLFIGFLAQTSEGNLCSHRGVLPSVHFSALKAASQSFSALCPGALHSARLRAALAELDNCAFVELALLLLDVAVLDVNLLPVPTSALPPGRCLCSYVGEKPHF